jgi:hypothetical protein
MNNKLSFGPVTSYFIGYESTDVTIKNQKYIEILPVANNDGLRLILRDQADYDSWEVKEDSERNIIVDFKSNLKYIDFKPMVVES